MTDGVVSQGLFLSAFALGYLLGAIPTAYWLGKLVYRINIFEHGSKNMGATNVSRVLGKGPFVFTLAIDIFKGIAAVLLTGFLTSPLPAPMSLRLVAGASAIIGHTLSFWVGFKGGKGVATGLGVFLGLTPLSSIGALAIFLTILMSSGFVSLGSIFASASLPFFIYFFREGGEDWTGWLSVFSAIIAGFIIFKHKANIGRIWRGEELSIHSSQTKTS